MRITFIGSGNVATHMAAAFVNAGHKITQVWSRNFEHAAMLAYHVKAIAISDLNELTFDTDLIVISVNDSAIPAITSQINFTNQLVVHTSGSVSLNALQNVSSQIGVLYPLQTFSKNKSVNFNSVPLLIEANTSEVLEKLRLIAFTISETVLDVDSPKRLALHVSAVFACNFSNYLYQISHKILADNKLDFSLLYPLIEETAQKIKTINPLQAQTGPALRNDHETLQKHLEFLKNRPDEHFLYEYLSQQIINLRLKP